jgi:hypothetical protein
MELPGVIRLLEEKTVANVIVREPKIVSIATQS